MVLSAVDVFVEYTVVVACLRTEVTVVIVVAESMTVSVFLAAVVV